MRLDHIGNVERTESIEQTEYMEQAESIERMEQKRNMEQTEYTDHMGHTDYERRLDSLLKTVVPADRAAMRRAKARWDSIAKPVGSLGLLEDDIIKIAGMTGNAENMDLDRSALAVFCADHGVVSEGVTQTGPEVTRIVAGNLTQGRTSVTAMCGVSETDVFPIDIGMLGGRSGNPGPPVPSSLADRKIRQGSGNIVREPAMSRTECIRALLVGIDLTRDLKAAGYTVLAAGEMGIGNTTPSSALAAVLCGITPGQAAGRGAGLSDEGYARKQRAVAEAVARYRKRNCCEPCGAEGTSGAQETSGAPGAQETPGASGAQEKSGAQETVTLLAELGGLDIAGLAGMFLGAAVWRIPVVLDGMISATAALCAVRICETVRDFLLASHISAEPAAEAVMKELGLRAPIHCGMRLGEGSGAVAFLPMLRMAAHVYREMSTFEEIRIERYRDYWESDERT